MSSLRSPSVLSGLGEFSFHVLLRRIQPPRIPHRFLRSIPSFAPAALRAALPLSPPFFESLYLSLTLTSSRSVAYQLGNMVSSASAQIEATAGANLKTATGKPAYGKVGAILIGVVAAWIIGCCLLGREQLGLHFEKGKAAFEKGGGRDEIEERASL